MVVRMKKFNILEIHWKIRLLSEGFTKNQYSWGGRGGLPKKGGGFGLFANLKGGLGKKEGVVVLRRKGGVETPLHTMNTHRALIKGAIHSFCVRTYMSYPNIAKHLRIYLSCVLKTLCSRRVVICNTKICNAKNVQEQLDAYSEPSKDKQERRIKNLSNI